MQWHELPQGQAACRCPVAGKGSLCMQPCEAENPSSSDSRKGGWCTAAAGALAISVRKGAAAAPPAPGVVTAWCQTSS